MAEAAAPRICKLEEDVVNKIAAGEVIHRPASALKEMLENSLDAGATQITIVTKQGGLKMLQIQDNGHGIRLEDMPIVCERFTTSKLRSFEDLQSINTFGFRGEALASITHVAKVTITTMTEGAPCAYKAQYVAGKVVQTDKKSTEPGKPKPCAGTRGTIICVEDLFYNVQTRRKALKSASEEYQRILEVVTRYAINNPSCSMNCRKAEANTSDIHTPKDSTATRNIGILFGQAVARELLPLSGDRTSEAELAYKVNGLISGANYISRKAVFILFINGRLVDCSSLKKAIETVYQSYLPKNTHPFVYLSLFIQPDRLDVNVHPTKKEVHFLNETEVVADLQDLVAQQLTGQNASRTFTVQPGLPSTPDPSSTSSDIPEESNAIQGTAGKKRLGSEMEATGGPAKPAHPAPINNHAAQKAAKELAYKMVRTAEQRGAMDRYVMHGTSTTAPPKAPGAGISTLTARLKKRRDDPNQLTSISNLLAATDASAHSLLSDLLRRGSFVGNVGHRFSLVQFRTGLYIMDMCAVTKELSRQLVLQHFGRMRKISITTKPLVKDLIAVALDLDDVWDPSIHGDKATIIKKAVDLLQSKAEMINEYFSIEIDAEGALCAIPQLLQDYIPPLSRLPLFLLRLAADVDWNYEQRCFDTLSQELADFCAFPDVLPPEDTTPSEICASQDLGTQLTLNTQVSQASDADGDISQIMPTASSICTPAANSNSLMGGGSSRHLQWLLQHVVWPTCRTFLVPPKCWATDGTVVQIACLENLYKVFERC